jgi:UDP-glucose 4-epimerase
MAQPVEEEAVRASEPRARSSWRGKRVLVTGGAGFIGSHVADALVERGAVVTVVDDFSTGFREFVTRSGSLTLVEGDLRDLSLCDRVLHGQEFVFHLAANADVKDGLLHPRRDVEQNVVVTQNVLEAMRAHGVTDIAFSSTGSVYGESLVLPTPEDAPFPVQTSLYATSKVAAEGLLSSYAFGYGFRAWIFRFVSMLGPRYTHGHVIDFWRKLRANPARLEVLGDGHQRKSYLHVGDCVAAMLLCIDRASEPVNVLNIGHSDWIEVNESIGIICREMKVSPRLEYTGGVRGWVGDSPKILLDTTRLRALGWAPTRSLEQSIVETLRFLAANPFCEEPRPRPS